MALPPTLSSWQLNLNANCLPDSMAPGSTMAFHFIEQLVANSARNGSEAAENMRKFGQRLLADQGWQSVEDIRNSATEPMLSTAAAACGVGAGYYTCSSCGTLVGPTATVERKEARDARDAQG